MPKMGNANRSIRLNTGTALHESLKRSVIHFIEIGEDAPCFLRRELHALVSLQGQDVSEHLVSYPRFILHPEIPPALAGITKRRTELWLHLPPASPDLIPRFNLDQPWPPSPYVVNQKVGGIVIRAPVTRSERDSDRLRNDLSNKSAEFCAYQEIAF